MELINHLLTLLEPYGSFTYGIIVAILLACGFGFPMPEDVILVTGGILASRSIIDVSYTVLASMIGVLGGDGIVFFIGRRVGPRIKLTRIYRKMMGERREARIQGLFAKYGDKVIFVARFAPGLRMPLFLTAGVYHVAPWKFFLLDGLAALISVPTWIWVGHFFGSNLELLEKKMHQMQLGLYSVLGIGAVLLVVYIMIKHKVERV